MVETPDRSRIDLSFIPSYFCNLKCDFCMYSCSPDNNIFMDMDRVKEFIDTIDWSWINSIGFYGGEVSLFIKKWNHILEYLPEDIEKWCITNGSWSTRFDETSAFMLFIQKYDIKCYVSSTPYHKKYQYSTLIDLLFLYGKLEIKDDDMQGHLLPMGRNGSDDWYCSKKCKAITNAVRYALTPTGNIIFQSCDGVYPIVGVDYPDFELVKEHCININGR